MLNEKFKRNLQDSYLTEDEKIIKSIETEELMKGKKAQLGEIREWGGRKMQKTTTGWVPAGAGKGKEAKMGDPKEESKGGVYENKKAYEEASSLYGALAVEGFNPQKDYVSLLNKLKSGKGKEAKIEGEQYNSNFNAGDKVEVESFTGQKVQGFIKNKLPHGDKYKVYFNGGGDGNYLPNEMKKL